ncbi:MAG TPA: glutathione peroxidase [Xanthobacteraceae bacterium]
MTASRRQFLALLTSALASPALAEESASRPTAYAFSFRGLAGGDIALSAYAGKPILVVNVASLCGYTPQYTGLQDLWTRYRGRGLTVLGVPSNDFFQEPGAAADIEATAHQYKVDFPLTEKASVKGAGAHPFYRWAALEKPLDPPRWNFHKYLVGDDGHIAAAFGTSVEPLDARVIAAIEKEIGKAA